MHAHGSLRVVTEAGGDCLGSACLWCSGKLTLLPPAASLEARYLSSSAWNKIFKAHMFVVLCVVEDRDWLKPGVSYAASELLSLHYRLTLDHKYARLIVGSSARPAPPFLRLAL